MTATDKSELRFEALFEIGRGGVAAVRAERMTSPGGATRTVAVKRLLPLVAGDQKTREMFLNEARLAAMLRHPNVVEIVAFGEDEEPFIAMELVPGEPLSAVIARARDRGEAPLAPPLAAGVIARVCDALHAAHELADPETGETLQLVHRDVSPQNILVGCDGTVRLTDFGIAKALGFGSRTRTGEVKGKLAYMSPEQAMCDPLDRRSDLFAVGAVLFECLSGRRMLGEGNDIDFLRRLANHEILPLTDAWAQAPDDLRALYAQLTARSPNDRPDSAADVAQALRTFAAQHGATDDTEAMALRMSELFPDGLEELRARLAGAESVIGRGDSPVDSTETFPDRASGLLRERRRARTMLAAGLTTLGLSVAFVASVLLTRGTAPARRPDDNIVLPSTSLVQRAVDVPSAAGSGFESNRAVPSVAGGFSPDRTKPDPARSIRLPSGQAGRDAGPGATTTVSVPLPKSSSPVRNDMLDEHPF